MNKEDGMQPATKGYLSNLEDSLVQRMDSGFQKVERKFNVLNEAIDRVLTVVVNIDKKLSGKVDDHERRIKRLESKVGSL